MKATRFFTLLALLLMAGGVTMQAQEVKVEASETIELMISHGHGREIHRRNRGLVCSV